MISSTGHRVITFKRSYWSSYCSIYLPRLVTLVYRNYKRKITLIKRIFNHPPYCLSSMGSNVPGYCSNNVEGNDTGNVTMQVGLLTISEIEKHGESRTTI